MINEHKEVLLNKNTEVNPDIKIKAIKRKEKIFLEWSNINYTITSNNKNNNKNKVQQIISESKEIENNDNNQNSDELPVNIVGDQNKKIILENIEGYALPNELLAIMGPSGSGKTSLLNLIACRQLPANKGHLITRVVKANNINVDLSNFGKICAYIMQEDILLDTLTPRESLCFCAKLKLHKTEQEINKRVDKLIFQFGLEKCANSRVGSLRNQGISGGERKRTSIAYEIISDPPIVIIDEPTTGMDSFTSLVIVKYLKGLANTGKTISNDIKYILIILIVCTIHQPSSEMLKYFDRLLLLKEGHLVFQGRTEWALKYFNEIGYITPEFCNPFDFFLEILSDCSHSSKELNDNYIKLCQEEVRDERVKLHEKYKMQEIHTFKQNLRSVSWCLEFWLLLQRMITNYFRNSTLLLSRILNSIFSTIIIVGFFWDIGATDKRDMLFQNYIGFFFNISNQFFINGIFTALFVIPVLKIVLKREYSAKLYRISTFYSALAISLLINSLIYVVIFTPVSFFTINFLMETAAANLIVFWIYFGLNFFIFTLGQFFGLLIGGSLPEKVSFIVSPLLFIFFMLGAGFFRGNNTLPAFISWIFYISPYKYFLELSLKNFSDFNEITKMIPEQMNYNYGVEVCVPVLIGTMVFVLILGYFGIKKYSAKF